MPGLSNQNKVQKFMAEIIFNGPEGRLEGRYHPVCPLANSTLKLALGSASVTVASTSILSFFAILLRYDILRSQPMRS